VDSIINLNHLWQIEISPRQLQWLQLVQIVYNSNSLELEEEIILPHSLLNLNFNRIAPQVKCQAVMPLELRLHILRSNLTNLKSSNNNSPFRHLQELLEEDKVEG
jgi:hypothetical protein